MIRTLNKEKVIKILTEEEYEYMNAFNIIPNLSDKVLDYAEKNYEIIEMTSQYLEEKRKQNSNLSIPLFVLAGVQARMKRLFAISELPLAITSQEIIEKLGINIEYHLEESLLKESNIRAFLERYKQEKDKPLEFQNEFIKSFNQINKELLKKAKLTSDIHVLDCTICDVNLNNENYEGSTVTYKGGEKLRGYKLGVLRGFGPNSGFIEEIVMNTAKPHDLKMSKDMILKSEYLKPGDDLIEDRGFLDIKMIRKLFKKGVNVTIPAKKNMEIHTAAVTEAVSKNEWKKHPNTKRKGQDITLVSNLEMFWLDEKDKEKKPENIHLEYSMHAAVIRFEKKLNQSILTDAEILEEDEKYAYAVILTTHPTRSAEEIIKLYELRPEIEEDFRQLKDFWGLTEYRSTQYHIISFVIMVSLLGYNLYQLYKESEEGKDHIGKSFIVEQRHGLYVVKNVRTAIIIDNYFAIFWQDELLDLYVELSKENRERLKQLLIL